MANVYWPGTGFATKWPPTGFATEWPTPSNAHTWPTAATTTFTPPGTPSWWIDAQDVNNGGAQPGNGSAIATWVNKGSVASGNAVQATGGLQPTFISVASAGKLGNKSCVRSGGTQWMQSANVTALTQPTIVYAICMTTTVAGGLVGVVDGNDGSNSNLLSRNAAVETIYAGSLLTGGNFVANTYHMAGGLYNNASSTIRLDGVQGGAGTVGAAIMDGITLFANGPVSSFWTGDIVEVLVYSGGGQPTAAQIESYFTSKYGAFPQ